MRPVFRRLSNGELQLDYSESAKKLKAAVNRSKKEKTGDNGKPKQCLTPDEVSRKPKL